MKLLPLPGKYRVAIGLGVIIAACHSGETREPVLLTEDDNPADSGSDAAVAGGTGISGGGGTSGDSPQQPMGGRDAGGGESGNAGTDNLGGEGNTDVPDASDGDAQVDADVDAAPRCGDGNTDLALDEECDDGNRQHTDGCELDCTKTTVKQLVFGRSINCALSSGGGVKCWGLDTYGALGQGTIGTDIVDPRQVPPYDFGTTRRVTQIAAGRYHVCVLFEDGKARCWGNNEDGQLGIGSLNNYGDQPTELLSELPDLPFENVQSIVTGYFDTCAIVGSGASAEVYCWGRNIRGEVGIASSEDEILSPTSPVDLNVAPKALVGGNATFCALLASNDARCWGHYSYGMRGVGTVNYYLGDNEAPGSNSFNVKGVPNPIDQITGFSSTYCALSGSDAYCWGLNDNANAGYPVGVHGTEIWQTPGKVNLGDVTLVQVSAGSTYGCGVDDEGIVRCWGSNLDDGALGYPYVYRIGFDREPVLDYQLMRDASDGGNGDAGDAGFVTPNLPLGAVDLGDFDETSGLDQALRVEAGYNRTCAIMVTGGLRCWGQNSWGLLGYPEIADAAFIGFTDSPAQAYQKLGYSDVKVFGPPP